MNTQQRVAVMQAYLDGKTIQCRRYGESSWAEFSKVSLEPEPGWVFDAMEYRVKPEPEELFITVKGDLIQALCAGTNDHGTNFIGGMYANGADAHRFVSDFPAAQRRVFKVTEVIE